MKRPRLKTTAGPQEIFFGWRLFLFYGVALLLTGGISLLFADLLWRRGWTPLSTILFALFVLLLFFNCVGATHGIYGFFLRRRGERQRITNLKDVESQDISETSTAILFPIYNEEAAEVYERLRAAYQALEETGHLARFDFFILSDSTEPANWLDEEDRWLKLTNELDGLGRIFYRHRVWNEEKKSGNIREFLNAFGNRYRYFIVFDADSLMTGKAMVSLVKLMEAHPDVGIIQTPADLINAGSLFGRIHQFANRLYSPLFTAGLNYWMQSFGNYVGHNAIIRTAPFMQYCGLPKIPGKKPFGGHILSHDFVEATLMLKNDWQVWLAHDLGGSYEEGPQGLIEYAQRDRRWCQGNLQHILVLFAPGLRGISRMHLLFGIFGYLGGPLWLLFLLAFSARLIADKETGLSDITVRSWTPFLHLSATQHAVLIFGLSMFVLLLPKILALAELAFQPERRRAFGGLGRACLSSFLELLFSTLQAPLLMLWHTEFVITIILGRSVSWGKQNRQADGASWGYALRQHWKHTLAGVLWGVAAWQMDHALFWWFMPVLAGMLFAIPFTVFSSRCQPGESSRKAGLFLTPEEVEPPKEIVQLRAALANLAKTAPTKPAEEKVFAETVLSPWRNALHLSLLQVQRNHPTFVEGVKKLGEGQPSLKNLRQKTMTEGWSSLNAKQKLLLLADGESLSWLHRELWRTPLNLLPKPWRQEFN